MSLNTITIFPPAPATIDRPHCISVNVRLTDTQMQTLRIHSGSEARAIGHQIAQVLENGVDRLVDHGHVDHTPVDGGRLLAARVQLGGEHMWLHPDDVELVYAGRKA